MNTENINNLFEEEEDFDRYGIPFATKNNKYYFDSGTGKVLQCTEEMYQLLVNLFENNGKIKNLDLSQTQLEETVQELRETIAEENIFKARKLDCFNCSHVNNLEGLVSQGCRQLILEVTEVCNLRCKYCIYGDDTKNFRSFGGKQMSVEIATKAVDYFVENGDKEKDLMISFYGGEPLLNYDLIVKVTNYSKKILGSRVTFNLTSNLTMLNQQMADFFAENDFRIVCSLDGDGQIHNENRVFAGGGGSYERTMEGLKLLYETYDEGQREYIGINSVIAPPYSEEKFDRINEFFDGLPYLDIKSPRSVSYVGRDVIADDSRLSSNMDIVRVSNRDKYDLLSWEYGKLSENQEKVFSNMLEDGLKDIHNRRISDIPFTDSGLNACCVPGIQRLYVSVEGSFYACERIGNSPAIGDVWDGISLDRIKKYYVDDYTQKSKENCGRCWALQLCNVCYARCFDNGGLDMKRKKYLCEGCRSSMYELLILYHMVLEEHPELLLRYNKDENE